MKAFVKNNLVLLTRHANNLCNCLILLENIPVIYEFSRFVNVLSVGLNTEEFNVLESNDFPGLEIKLDTYFRENSAVSLHEITN